MTFPNNLALKKSPQYIGGFLYFQFLELKSKISNLQSQMLYMACGGAGSSGLPALLTGILVSTQPTTRKTSRAGMN
jgi:hypothetical protein